jgi:hypothetical protein
MSLAIPRARGMRSELHSMQVTVLPLAISRRHLGSGGGEGWAESAPGHIRAGTMLRSRCSPKQLPASLAAARRRRWGRAPAIDGPPCSLAASSVSRICRMTSVRG